MQRDGERYAADYALLQCACCSTDMVGMSVLIDDERDEVYAVVTQPVNGKAWVTSHGDVEAICYECKARGW